MEVRAKEDVLRAENPSGTVSIHDLNRRADDSQTVRKLIEEALEVLQPDERRMFLVGVRFAIGILRKKHL